MLLAVGAAGRPAGGIERDVVGELLVRRRCRPHAAGRAGSRREGIFGERAAGGGARVGVFNAMVPGAATWQRSLVTLRVNVRARARRAIAGGDRRRRLLDKRAVSVWNTLRRATDVAIDDLACRPDPGVGGSAIRRLGRVCGRHFIGVTLLALPRHRVGDRSARLRLAPRLRVGREGD